MLVDAFEDQSESLACIERLIHREAALGIDLLEYLKLKLLDSQHVAFLSV